jgi:hypothetical protein
MNWEQDIGRALAPGFPYDPDASEDSLNLLRRMYEELDGPVGDGVPDIIQLIHWGAAWWYLKPESKDYAGTDYRLHPETLSTFAAFLYAHPWMEEWIAPRFRDRISQFAFENWEPHGLLTVRTNIGTFKGRYPPGWSVLPNLMMHEVAKREARPDADRYLDAAVAQVDWMIEHLDLAAPLVTKGQRMSEHKTLNGLAVLALHYPDRAPARLQPFIRQWADIAIARSENLWDYRRYDLDQNWSLPRSMPGHTGGGSSWNDPGNLAGFPALAWNAVAILGYDQMDRARSVRLHQIAVAQWDILFGRNPLGCHSAWRGGLDWVGVERGWPVKYRPVCAYLETVRGTFCSSPATEHFPFNPAGQFRHPEGWTAFNAAFNVSLAESVRGAIRITHENGTLTLQGPFFVPSINVDVIDVDSTARNVMLSAVDNQQIEFRDELRLPRPFRVRYGHGFFASETSFLDERRE